MEECKQVRESLSAILDGERPRLTRAQVDIHLAGCDACGDWQDQAHAVTRHFRVRSATTPLPVPNDLLADVVGRRARATPTLTTVTRAALAGVAVLQLLVTGRLLVSGAVDGFRDLGSLDLALAVGYLVAALRPQRAAGMRSVAGAAAILLAGSALVDLAAHRTTAMDEAPHLITLAGWFLVSLLAWRSSGLGIPPGTAWGRAVDRISIWNLVRSRRVEEQENGSGPFRPEPASVDQRIPAGARTVGSGSDDRYLEAEAVGQ